MTVSSSSSRDQYSGNGAQVAFPITFQFQSSADIKVTLLSGGVETDQIDGSDYYVSLPTLSVVMSVAPAVGETLTITRNITLSQETDYVENDNFPAQSHENALDKLTMITQQLNEVDTRSLKLVKSENIGNISLEIPVIPDSYLRWNSAGDTLENFPTLAGLEEIYFGDDIVLKATDRGIDIFDASGAPGNRPKVILKSDVNAELVTLQSLLGDAYLNVDTNGGHMYITGKNSSGLPRTFVEFNPDTNLNFIHPETDEVMLGTVFVDGKRGIFLASGSVSILTGTGDPNGVLTANQGSIYLRTDGDIGTTFYVKGTIDQNTGWVAGLGELYFGNNIVLKPIAKGIEIFDTDGNDPGIEFNDNLGNILSQITVDNGNMGLATGRQTPGGASVTLSGWNGSAYESLLVATQGGACRLNHAGSKSLETILNGAAISQNLIVRDSFDVDLFRLRPVSSDAYFETLKISANLYTLGKNSLNETRFFSIFSPDGSLIFYHPDINDVAFRTISAAGGRVGIGLGRDVGG
ncbi:MAG: hypothetical protein R3250_09510, partial [Melioribacteraceae bacterium]|nr:hypothetical protein [Melioribacteraceae bacterium]